MHSGLRSPWITPAPSNVVSRDTPRSRCSPWSSSGSRSAVRARISAQIAARPRRSTPARAAATRISSAVPRYSAGMALVHLASCRASDLVSTQPSASAACSTRWPRASAWTARCSAAWPLVTRSEWISQARVLRCPPARCPSWESKTSSSRPRTAAPAASARSRARSWSATARAGRPAASWAARNRSTRCCVPSAASSMPSASAAVAGSVVVHMSWLTSPGPDLDAVPDPTLTGGSDISGWPATAFDYVFGEN